MSFIYIYIYICTSNHLHIHIFFIFIHIYRLGNDISEWIKKYEYIPFNLTLRQFNSTIQFNSLEISSTSPQGGAAEGRSRRARQAKTAELKRIFQLKWIELNSIVELSCRNVGLKGIFYIYLYIYYIYKYIYLK